MTSSGPDCICKHCHKACVSLQQFLRHVSHSNSCKLSYGQDYLDKLRKESRINSKRQYYNRKVTMKRNEDMTKKNFGDVQTPRKDTSQPGILPQKKEELLNTFLSDCLTLCLKKLKPRSKMYTNTTTSLITCTLQHGVKLIENTAMMTRLK